MKKTIERKINPKTPDEVCEKCSQNYQSVCRAFCMPHSDKEAEARTSEYGMECDNTRLKETRKKLGVMYHTP